MELYKKRDWLYKKYTEERKSTVEIGKILRCNSSTIWRWLLKFDIPIKDQSKEFKGCHFSRKTEFKKGTPFSFKKGHIVTPEVRKKLSKAHVGKKLSEKHKKKISESLKGKTTWNKGIPHSKETKKKMSKAHMGGKNPHYGKHLSVEHRKKLSEAHKGKRLSKEHIRKCLARRTPSSLEERFQQIIDKFDLPYKYVGNGTFFIERKNPDFININGDKIAIEVYARYYKKRHGGIDEWKQERTKLFAEYGWDIIFFNEIEVNEENVLKHLQGGG